jgi:hypothetical protein
VVYRLLMVTHRSGGLTRHPGTKHDVASDMHHIPQLIKSSIGWAARPYGDSAYERESVAVMGAWIGMLGSADAPVTCGRCERSPQRDVPMHRKITPGAGVCYARSCTAVTPF